MNRIIILLNLAPLFLIIRCSIAQETNLEEKSVYLSDYTKSFLSLDYSRIALINVKVIDGTGIPAKESQTILIQNGIIVDVRNASDVIPEDFHPLHLEGRTIIPGIIGMHNHMRLPSSAMLSTSPRLYLACGVTTIQTCGTGNPYEELAIAKSIKRGEQPGPEIINSGPYFTGPDGKSNFIRCTDEQMVRDTIKYWAQKGIKWLKVYRNTRPADLRVIVDEAHKNNMKVTGHLCATTYAEAAEIGIDAIEHGFIHSYDYVKDRVEGTCSGNTEFRTLLDVKSQQVIELQKKLTEKGVALGSTLAIFEAQANGKAEPRDLEVMAPFHLDHYHNRRKRKQELGEDWYFKEEWLTKSMAYDLQFYRHGGLLVAGPDPGLHNMPGFGDQKNYELFIEAGFKPEEAIEVMTANGAKLLGRNDLGTIEKVKAANLVILDGDLVTNPGVIRKVEMVFKEGIGYDPSKLIRSVKGNVGSVTDDLMIYFGQKEPTLTPEIFAPNIISKPGRHEFGSTFSKEGNEFYFGVDNNGIMEIHFSKLIEGVWTPERKLFDSDSISYNDPMFSPDEKRLYFITNRPIKNSTKKDDTDIWYVEREDADKPWSNPIHAGNLINSDVDEYYASFTRNGTLYFASKDKKEKAPPYAFDIYRAGYKDGKFLSPEKLPETVNTGSYEADVFVASDESYVIFCSIRQDGLGQGDLYISFKDEKGHWSEAVNMGDSINTEKHELCPFVSANGKYLFYTSDQDIYWISAKILENYR